MVIGIDCSKDTLDVAVIDSNKAKFVGKFNNNLKGFEKLQKSVIGSDLIVMEATGPYYMPVAFYLKEKGFSVSVVNPLIIKRYCQMKLVRAKTDKQDAIMIARYGQAEKPDIWNPPSALIIQIQQLETYLDGLKKRRSMVSNQLHSFKHTHKLTEELKKDLEDEIKEYTRKITNKEREINELLEKEHQKLVKDLQSIPGIGPRSSSLLTITTNGFKDFESHKQVISYYGLAPRKYESGISVKGRSSICKMGMANVRKTLYMAAQSAMVYNKACRDLYQRLKGKGKPHRVAKIAVVNKLIKQAFAIAKSGLVYQEDFSLT